MDLDSIKNRKIRSQLRYLQLELEETKIIYEECLLKFNNDFRSYMMDTQPDLSAPPQTSKDKNLEIKTDVEEDTFKQVYRKVAGKTHPDKGGDSDKFKKANEANRNKDLGALMEMADELGVEVPMDNDMRNQLSCCLPKCRWCVLDQRIERRISLFQTHWKRFIRHRYQILQARETSGRWIRVGGCQ